MAQGGQNLRSTVLVGNIPYEVSEQQLKDVFAQIGPVVSIRFFYDKDSSKHKGYGICEYRDPDMALSAVRNLNGYEIKGKMLRVDISTSERSRDELKNLQMSLGGASSESSRDQETDSEKAPEAISKAVASLPPEQMFELMKQMKMCIQNNPNEARNLLLQNPQLAYALLQAQVVMRIVDPQVALNILNRPPPNTNTVSTSSTSESESVKTVTSTMAPAASAAVKTTTAPALPVPVSSSMSDSMVSNVPLSVPASIAATSAPSVTSASLTSTPATEASRSLVPPPRSSQVGDMHGPLMTPDITRTSVPQSRHQPQRDAFGPFGDPRTVSDRDMRMPSRVDHGDARLSSRIDQDMRQPPTSNLDQDMRQPMGDMDFRMMRGPQSMENRPFDPRLRAVGVGDTTGGRPAPVSAPYDPRGSHPFDPRTAHDLRSSAPPPRLEDPRTAMRSQSSRAGPTVTSGPSLFTQSQSLPNVGNARPPSSVIAAANAIAPHDQEKAALIMQVLQLSDEQIAMLPSEQRQSILILKEQIARSCPPQNLGNL